MVDQVIIPVADNAEDFTALPVGRALARHLGVPIAVLSIVGEADEIEGRRSRLQAVLAESDAGDAEIQVVADHAVAERLVAETRHRPNALICMSTHARPPAREYVLGSVAEQVVRHAGMPTVLVGPRAETRGWNGPRTLVVPLDGSELAEAMLPAAAGMAHRLSAALQLVRVVTPDTRRGEEAPAKPDEAYLKGVAEEVEEKHGVSPECKVISSDSPARALVQHARALPGAMVAMTTHGRSGLAQVVLGSISVRVVHDAPCPVMVFRPS